MTATRGGMPYLDFLNAIIDDGIEAARADYTKPHQTNLRDGAIAGFEECRGLDIMAVEALALEAAKRARQAMQDRAADHWYWRGRSAEIGWVRDVVTAVQWVFGHAPQVRPSGRALVKAYEILGGEPFAIQAAEILAGMQEQTDQVDRLADSIDEMNKKIDDMVERLIRREKNI